MLLWPIKVIKFPYAGRFPRIWLTSAQPLYILKQKYENKFHRAWYTHLYNEQYIGIIIIISPTRNFHELISNSNMFCIDSHVFCCGHAHQQDCFLCTNSFCQGHYRNDQLQKQQWETLIKLPHLCTPFHTQHQPLLASFGLLTFSSCPAKINQQISWIESAGKGKPKLKCYSWRELACEDNLEGTSSNRN